MFNDLHLPRKEWREIALDNRYVSSFQAVYGRWRDTVPTSVPLMVTVALLVVVAFVTRFWGIGDKSIWLDEASSWQAAIKSFSDMMEWTAGDKHPPLYYAILRPWVAVFGETETVLRAPSAIASALTVITLGIVSWRIGGRWLGVASVALLVLNAVFLEYAQTAGMYAMMGLFSLGATIALASFISKPTLVRGAAYTFFGLCLVYTHYSGLLLIATQWMVLAIYSAERVWRGKQLFPLLTGEVAFIAIGMAFLPWLSRLREGFGTGVGHIPEPSWDGVASVTRAAVGFEGMGIVWLFVAIACLGLGLNGVRKRIRQPLVVCLCALALVPLAQLVISVLFTPIFDVRQVSPFIPGVVFLMALGVLEAGLIIGRFSGWPRRASNTLLTALVGGLIIVLMGGVIDWYRAPPIADWRQVAEDVRDEPTPIFLWKNYLAAPMGYYLGSSERLNLLTWPAMRSTANGFTPFPRSSQGDEAILILAHHRRNSLALTEALLSVSEEYFTITEPEKYRGGILSYRLHAASTAEYNVDVFNTYKASERWSSGANGNLITHHGRSYFTLGFSPDQDGDGSANESFSLHIEYRDSGPSKIVLGGFDSRDPQAKPVWLATEPILGTDTWRSIDIMIEADSQLTDRFFLTKDLVIRTLEARRYTLEGAKLSRNRDDEQRGWFLRTDGYLQTTKPSSCVQSNIPMDDGGKSIIVEVVFLEERGWTVLKLPERDNSRLVCIPGFKSQQVVRNISIAQVSALSGGG